MAYNKLKVPILELPGILCKVCKDLIPLKEWFPLTWEGTGPPPEEEYGVCEQESWRAESMEWEDYGGNRDPKRRSRSYTV